MLSFRGHGNAVQRPAQSAGSSFGLQPARHAERLLSSDGDERVQRRLAGLDPAQAGFRELDRREVAAPNGVGRLSERQTPELGAIVWSQVVENPSAGVRVTLTTTRPGP